MAATRPPRTRAEGIGELVSVVALFDILLGFCRRCAAWFVGFGGSEFVIVAVWPLIVIVALTVVAVVVEAFVVHIVVLCLSFMSLPRNI